MGLNRLSAVNQFLSNAAFSAGYSIVRHTESRQVRELIAKMTPQDCGRDMIRLGGPADGGYLIPNDLDGIQYCFSPGVSNVADFESDLANRGITSFMADYSVEGPPINRPEFVFEKKFLGCVESDTCMTLGAWKNKSLPGYADDLLLQMDIEGAEYEVIANASRELLAQFRILVIEFHQLREVFEPFFFRIFSSCIEKLTSTFAIVHLHPNNGCGLTRKGDLEIPNVLEVTFYNRNRCILAGKSAVIPHPLDRENFPALQPLALPACWLRGGTGKTP